MQFALPPRKSSHPSLYSRSTSTSSLRQRQLKLGAIVACMVLSVLYLLSHIFSSSSPTAPLAVEESAPPPGPKVVLVTLLDEQTFSDKYIQRIKQNREDYVSRHGYVNFFASTDEYAQYLGKAPRSWAIPPAMRHAMAIYPGSTYFFYLSPHALILDPSLPITSHVLDKKRLESLMIKNTSIVPPNSVIKTFSHLSEKDVDFIISQDGKSLSPGSFILRRGDWAQFFLDVWFDPLYRSYNFAKAEVHALDHIVQWHPTILAKLALIPQDIINSYSPQSPYPGKNGVYKDGDFLIRFDGCETNKKRNCEDEMDAYWSKWAKATGNE